MIHVQADPDGNGLISIWKTGIYPEFVSGFFIEAAPFKYIPLTMSAEIMQDGYGVCLRFNAEHYLLYGTIQTRCSPAALPGTPPPEDADPSGVTSCQTGLSGPCLKH